MTEQDQTQIFEPWTWTWTAGAMRGRSHVINTSNCVLQPLLEQATENASPIMAIRHSSRGLLLQCRDYEIAVNGVSGYQHVLFDGDIIRHSTFAARVSVPQFKRPETPLISTTENTALDSFPFESDPKDEGIVGYTSIECPELPPFSPAFEMVHGKRVDSDPEGVASAVVAKMDMTRSSLQIEPSDADSFSGIDEILAKLRDVDDETFSFTDAYDPLKSQTITPESKPNLAHVGTHVTQCAIPDETYPSGEFEMKNSHGNNPDDSELSTAHFIKQFADDKESPAAAPPHDTAEAATNTDPPSIEDHGGDVHSEDVDDYMNRLFKRLRGSGVEQRTPVAEKHEAPKPEVKIENSHHEKIESHQASMKDEEYLPKKQAPEKRASMDALRKLANDSTRMAIDSHCKQREKTTKTARLAMIVAGIVVSMVFAFMSKKLGDLSSVISGVGSVATVGVFLYHLLASAKDRESEDTENA